MILVMWTNQSTETLHVKEERGNDFKQSLADEKTNDRSETFWHSDL